MESRVGPAAMLRQLSERAPDLMEQLPRLPELLLNATQGLQRLDDLARQQHKATRELTALLQAQQHRTTRKRWLGGALLLGGGALLWSPVASALADGQSLSVTAGLLAALLGSLLIVRA